MNDGKPPPRRAMLPAGGGSSAQGLVWDQMMPPPKAFPPPISYGPPPVVGIEAYHGSPHDFDRFDSSKIGTGEGAQAYGHGLYFAGNEKVAQAYRDKLAGPPTPWNMMYDGSNVWGNFSDYFDKTPHVRPGAIELHKRLSPYKEPGNPDIIARVQSDLEKTLENYRKADIAGKPFFQEKFSGDYESSRKDYQAALDLLRDKRFKINPDIPSPGKMYNVDLQVNPNRLLDWDKPLNKHPDKVLDALEPLWSKYSKLNSWEPGTGSDFYRTLSNAATPLASPRGFEEGKRRAADILKDAGIPGVRYLDQGSRNTGAGTSNYVIFPGQDDRIKIRRKYKKGGMY